MGNENYEGYDRVSHILSPFNGYGKIDQDVLDRAAHRGTRVHNIITEELLIKTPKEDRLGVEGYIHSFEKFWADYQGEILHVEKRIKNDNVSLTGEFDLIARIAGQYVLIDWKTSVSLNRTWALQGAAYRMLANDAGIEIDACWFVQLDKKGKEPKVHVFGESNDYKANLSMFWHCVHTYRYFFKDQNIQIFED